MLFRDKFYHGILRKYVIAFGSMFKDIYLQREAEDGTQIQDMLVPISYGPKQKYLARLDVLSKAGEDDRETDPTKVSVSTLLPRMAFEMNNVYYDSQRRLSKSLKLSITNPTTDNRSTAYTPAPYNLDFTLWIMVKSSEDGTRIVEQILPFFSPDYTVTLNLVPELGKYGKLDVPITLNSAKLSDSYEGPVVDKRYIIWELQFTLKAIFFGPVFEGKPIKNIYVNFKPVYGNQTAEEAAEAQNTSTAVSLNTRPGLTANGTPTTSLSNTIPFAQINEEDNWGFIETINEYF